MLGNENLIITTFSCSRASATERGVKKKKRYFHKCTHAQRNLIELKKETAKLVFTK